MRNLNVICCALSLKPLMQICFTEVSIFACCCRQITVDRELVQKNSAVCKPVVDAKRTNLNRGIHLMPVCLIAT